MHVLGKAARARLRRRLDPRLFLGLALCAFAAQAQDADAPRAAQVKAAVLVNFLRYSEWPPERFGGADAPYRIAVVNGESVADVLDNFAGSPRRINNRGLALMRLRLPPSGLAGLGSESRVHAIEALRAQHLIYVDDLRGSATAELLHALDGAGVLSVGEGREFLGRGGMIGLDVESNHVVFDANLVALRQAPVMVSAKVLKLARHIEGGPTP